jgi:glutaminyl-tRNA synthetase
MPPKFDPTKPENAALISAFAALGLGANSATELVRTPKSGKAFQALVDEYGLAGKTFEEKQANALVKLSAVGAKLSSDARKYVVERIVSGDLKSPDQVAGKSGARRVHVHSR